MKRAAHCPAAAQADCLSMATQPRLHDAPSFGPSPSHTTSRRRAQPEQRPQLLPRGRDPSDPERSAAQPPGPNSASPFPRSRSVKGRPCFRPGPAPASMASWDTQRRALLPSNHTQSLRVRFPTGLPFSHLNPRCSHPDHVLRAAHGAQAAGDKESPS